MLQKATLCVIEPGLLLHSTAKHSCHSQLCLLSITWNSIWMRFRALQITGDFKRNKTSFPKEQSNSGKKWEIFSAFFYERWFVPLYFHPAASQNCQWQVLFGEHSLYNISQLWLLDIQHQRSSFAQIFLRSARSENDQTYHCQVMLDNNLNVLPIEINCSRHLQCSPWV